MIYHALSFKMRGLPFLYLDSKYHFWKFFFVKELRKCWYTFILKLWILLTDPLHYVFFIKGVKPPQKQKQTSDERRAREHDYDQKSHKRAFKDDWKNGRPWLRLEKKDDTEVMFCDFCIFCNITV